MSLTILPDSKRSNNSSNTSFDIQLGLSSLPQDMFILILKKCFYSFESYDIQACDEIKLRLVDKQWSIIITERILPQLWNDLSQERGLIDYAVLKEQIGEKLSHIGKFRMLSTMIRVECQQFLNGQLSSFCVSKKSFTHLEGRLKDSLKKITHRISTAEPIQAAQLLNQLMPLPLYFRGNIPARLYYNLGEAYQRLNQFPLTLEMYDRCLYCNPKDLSILGIQYYHRALCLGRLQRNFTSELKKCAETLQLCPHPSLKIIEIKAHSHATLGRQLMQTDLLAARVELDQAASLYLEAARMAQKQGTNTEVHPLLALAWHCEPKGDLLAKYYLYTGETQQDLNAALTFYKQGLDSNPEDIGLRAKLYVAYSDILKQHTQDEEAISQLKKALDECTGDQALTVSLYSKLIDALYYYNEDNEVIRDELEKAIAICSPTEIKSYGQLQCQYGVILAELTDYDSATRALKQVIDVYLWKVLVHTLLNKDHKENLDGLDMLSEYLGSFDDNYDSAGFPPQLQMCFFFINAANELLEKKFQDSANQSLFGLLHADADKDKRLTTQLHGICAMALMAQKKFDLAIRQVELGFKTCPTGDLDLMASLHLQYGRALKGKDQLNVDPRSYDEKLENWVKVKAQFELGLKICPTSEAGLISSLKAARNSIVESLAVHELRKQNERDRFEAALSQVSSV